jgi:hypothetical protein
MTLKIDGRRRKPVDKELQEVVRNAASTASHILNNVGITDSFTTKIHPFVGRLVMYRNGSQFTSNPTFWVNSDAPRIESVIIDALLREYAHVIHEWVVENHTVLFEMIADNFEDGEMFEDTMVRVFKGDHETVGNIIVSRYAKSKFGIFAV